VVQRFLRKLAQFADKTASPSHMPHTAMNVRSQTLFAFYLSTLITSSMPLAPSSHTFQQNLFHVFRPFNTCFKQGECAG